MKKAKNILRVKKTVGVTGNSWAKVEACDSIIQSTINDKLAYASVNKKGTTASISVHSDGTIVLLYWNNVSKKWVKVDANPNQA